ncbi:MAG: pilin [Candidatus Accumulibacter sp.]|jgi:type IV pilus assembly protein PilA|nr:pilin [Accumulibacter sp.]
MSRPRQQQYGFNLVELMVVVAIVAVLSAVAIPQYQSYVARAQAARVVSETGELRTNVEHCVNEGKTALGTGADDCDPGGVGSNLVTYPGAATSAMQGSTPPTGMGTSAVTLGGTNPATIEAEFGNTAAAALHGKKVTWTRDAEGTWTCSTDINAKYRPAGCR